MRGAHPEVMARLVATNFVQTAGYGNDEFCRDAADAIRRECMAPDAEVCFLVGGTQTNATMIDALTSHAAGILASVDAHINVHESGAVEACGKKVVTLPGVDAKITASSIEEYLESFYADSSWSHRVIPAMVYISQPTEFGTLYSLAELEAIAEVCKRYDLKLFVDGARLIYALASEENDVSFADLARLSDAFYIGGTKAGLLFGEAVVIREGGMMPYLSNTIKKHGALLAKGRLLGVQFEAMFTDGLYCRMGENAIRQAMKLRAALREKGWKPLAESPTNQQIFNISEAQLAKIAEFATFDDWGVSAPGMRTVRFTTDWSTTDSEIEEFIKRLEAV